jgi:hypothetical protein
MILKGFQDFINESQSEATYADLKLLLELGLVQDIANDVGWAIRTSSDVQYNVTSGTFMERFK